MHVTDRVSHWGRRLIDTAHARVPPVRVIAAARVDVVSASAGVAVVARSAGAHPVLTSMRLTARRNAVLGIIV